MKRLLLHEVADRLRMSIRRVQGLISAGELAAINVSGTVGSKRPRFVVDESDLADFERRRRTGPALTLQRPRRDAVPNYFSREAKRA